MIYPEESFIVIRQVGDEWTPEEIRPFTNSYTHICHPGAADDEPFAEWKKEHPNVPLSEIGRFRFRMAHNYADVVELSKGLSNDPSQPLEIVKIVGDPMYCWYLKIKVDKVEK